MNKLALLLSIACLACGCKIYTRYSRPEMEIDSLFRDSAKNDTATIATVAWQDFFTDTCLKKLIAAGLEKNTDLNVARLQTDEAKAVLMNARLSLLPSIQADPSAGIKNYNGNTEKTWQLGGSVSWEIDLFGKINNAKRSARAALESSQAYTHAVQTRLIATIAESYYTLLLLDEQLAVARETLENWEETIFTLSALREAGKVNDIAVLQAKANRTALEASVLSTQESIHETENSLCALLKESSHPVERSNLESQFFKEDLAIGIPIQLLANRPDIQQAEATLAEAFYTTNAARSAFYPSLTLSGLIGWTNNGGGAILNPGKWLASALGQLIAPLFNHGTNVANLKIAKARQEEALLRFEQSLLDAGKEVNDALTRWQTANGRIELDSLQIAHLEDALEKTRLLVRYSEVNSLEILTAQQSLLNARLSLVQDRIEKINGVVHLYHALGGGSY